MKHRVVKDCRKPLVGAVDTVKAGNIVVMYEDWSFVAPLATDIDLDLDLKQCVKLGDLSSMKRGADPSPSPSSPLEGRGQGAPSPSQS